MKITYTQRGDYMYPDLMLPPDMPEMPTGKYASLRRTYLREHHKIIYYDLLTACELTRHLTEVQQTAERWLEEMMPKLAKEAGATEALKAADPMKWVGLMNNCKAMVEEKIMRELVYNMDSV